MTRIESIIALLKANTGASTVAPTTVATYANLAETITLETISSGIMATSPLKGAFDGLPTADLLDQMFISLFGYTQAEMDALKATEAGAAGYQYWINELANNSDMINVNTLAIALLNGAAAADATKAAALVADDVDAYEIYAGTGETPVETEGQTVYLTSNQDILVGTDGNDTFVARGNNTLTNADIIDGGKGTDTVYVMLDNKETAESPLLTNIEILKVQAQATTEDSGDNDVDASNLPNADIESNIDAGDMKSVEVYINDNSRADLTIEDVSRNSHITTLVMRETDMGDVDYNVFFDPENITAPGTADQGATLLIKLANVLNIAENTNPVENFEALTFTVGATTVTADISAATSYDDVVTAIEAAIAAKGLVGLTVQKQADAPAYFSIDVATYAAGQLAGSYNPILITNNGSGVLTPGQIELANNTTNANMTNTMTNVEGSTIPSLTQTNVVFDRVGRDSKGGDFIAGSDSTGNSGSKGIEQFNVSVDRDSWLTSVSSTNNTLEVINIKNIKENSNGNGSLRVDSISDVRVIDASAMTGKANITATLSDKIVDKYLNLTDDQSNPAADNSDDNFLNVVDTYFSYDFGSNNDTFNLTIDGSNLAAAGTTTREDFVMEINGGAGNDTITTDITAMTAFGYANSKLNANLTINGGEGNDTIWTKGEGDIKINAGAGNDTVYTDNTGAQAAMTYNDGKAAFVFNNNAVSDNNNVNDLLSNAITTVNGVNLGLTVTFQGITTDVSVVADSMGKTSNVAITNLHVNQAIKDAINNDAVLSKVLVAVDGPAGTLIVKSLIDGVMDAADLTINLNNYNVATTGVITASQITAQNAITPALNKTTAATFAPIYSTDLVGDDIAQVFTLDLDDTLVVNDGSDDTEILFDGTNIALADGDTDIEVAAALAAGNYADWTAVDNGDGTVTFTEKVAGSQATVDITNFTFTSGTEADIGFNGTVTTDVTGVNNVTLTGADASHLGTDNTITLGTGDDVLVLSTDANSSETIVFTAAFGNETIFNFNATNSDAGEDKLDFSALLSKAATGVDAGQVLTAATFDGTISATATANLTAAIAVAGDTLAGNTSLDIVLLTDTAADAGTAYVYQITDGNGATADATATFLGTITLADDGTDANAWAAVIA